MRRSGVGVVVAAAVLFVACAGDPEVDGSQDTGAAHDVGSDVLQDLTFVAATAAGPDGFLRVGGSDRTSGVVATEVSGDGEMGHSVALGLGPETGIYSAGVGPSRWVVSGQACDDDGEWECAPRHSIVVVDFSGDAPTVEEIHSIDHSEWTNLRIVGSSGDLVLLSVNNVDQPVLLTIDTVTGDTGQLPWDPGVFDVEAVRDFVENFPYGTHDATLALPETVYCVAGDVVWAVATDALGTPLPENRQPGTAIDRLGVDAGGVLDSAFLAMDTRNYRATGCTEETLRFYGAWDDSMHVLTIDATAGLANPESVRFPSDLGSLETDSYEASADFVVYTGVPSPLDVNYGTAPADGGEAPPLPPSDLYRFDADGSTARIGMVPSMARLQLSPEGDRLLIATSDDVTVVPTH